MKRFSEEGDHNGGETCNGVSPSSSPSRTDGSNLCEATRSCEEVDRLNPLERTNGLNYHERTGDLDSSERTRDLNYHERTRDLNSSERTRDLNSSEQTMSLKESNQDPNRLPIKGLKPNGDPLEMAPCAPTRMLNQSDARIDYKLVEINRPEPNSSTRSNVSRQRHLKTDSSSTLDQISLKKTKSTGLIRLVGAPSIDLAEAKRLVLNEEQCPVIATPTSVGMLDMEQEQIQVQALDKSEDSLSSSHPYQELGHGDGEYLDGGNEESFTLETFENLIRAARASNKIFILARVTTVDPSNLLRLYYSYYAAHHINKVIFRTQPEQGLLHRMKSRNPLNNMMIVGDVHYFAITPEAVDRAWRQQELERESRKVLRTTCPPKIMTMVSDDDVGREREGHVDFERIRDQTLLRNAILRNASMNGHRRSCSESMTLHEQQLLVSNGSIISLPELAIGIRAEREHYNGKGDGGMDEESKAPPVIYEANYLGTDDDFLMRSDMRELFKVNSVNPEDYQLFQLYRRSEHMYNQIVLGPDGRPLAENSNPLNGDPHGARSRWRTAGGLLDGGQHVNLVGCHTGWLSPFGFWLVTLLMVGTVVMLVLLYIPAPFHYFTIGGSCLLFVILLLFFVDWTDEAAPAYPRSYRQ